MTKPSVLVATLLTVAAAPFTVAQQPRIPAPPASADPTNNASIEGRVMLPTGQIPSGAVRIRLSTANDPGQELYTDSDGRFSFKNLRAGNYTVEATGDGAKYDPSSEQVRLIRGMRAMLTIVLREKSTEARKSSGSVVSAPEQDPAAPDAAKKEFQKASQLANKGLAEEAIERYKRAISIYPNYVMAHNDLGVQYLDLKRFAEARVEFETAIEISAKAFNPHLNMGILLVTQRQFSEALDQLREAESLDSSSPAAHLYLGITAEETDDLEAAERHLRTALSIGGPEYSVAHFYLGLTFSKKGEAAAAVQDLRSYLKDSPNGEHASRARKLLQSLETPNARQ